MKRITLILLLFAFCVPAFAHEGQLQKATNVIEEIMATPDKGIPQDLLKRAVCVGIIPSELKGAFVFGGSYGRGVLVCRDNGTGPWGAPSMFTIGSGSVGLQIGGKATDVVFIVMDPRGAQKLVQDSVKLGAELSVAAGPVGRSAEGATDAQMRAEILSYSRSRGLFAGVSLDGTVVKQDWDDNQQLYGHRVSAKQILFGGQEAVPAEARGLDDTLAKYSPKGGQQMSQSSLAQPSSGN